MEIEEITTFLSNRKKEYERDLKMYQDMSDEKWSKTFSSDRQFNINFVKGKIHALSSTLDFIRIGDFRI